MIKCDYCGRENQSETEPCPGCGTPPPPDPDDIQGKPSRPVSVGGLLDCAIGVAKIAAGDPAGTVHLVGGLSKLRSPPDGNSPHGLLERAALLESLDMRQAIALYKQIALSYPGTLAAEEAGRNLQTLMAAHPELE